MGTIRVVYEIVKLDVTFIKKFIYDLALPPIPPLPPRTYMTLMKIKVSSQDPK
jgi:hypothetical protein